MEAPETLDVVEAAVRELLSSASFDGETPIVRGSARCAISGEQPELGRDAVAALLSYLDAFIPSPVPRAEQPCLMPVEEVMSIAGRGVVASGRVEAGVIRVRTVPFIGLAAAAPHVLPPIPHPLVPTRLRWATSSS